MSRIKNNKAIKVLLILMMFITLLPTNIIKVHAAQEYNITIEDGEAEVDGVQVTKAEAGKIISIDADKYKGDKAFSHWEVISGGVTLNYDKNEIDNAFVMPANDVVMKAVYERAYNVTVQNGYIWLAGLGTSYNPEKMLPNTIVKIGYGEANSKFIRWEVVSGGVKLQDPNYPVTTFIMPANDVVIKAIDKEKEIYNIHVEGGNADQLTSVGKREIKINALHFKDKAFSRWEVVSGGVKLKDPNAFVTTFIMPENDVSIKAIYDKAYKIDIEEGGHAYIYETGENQKNSVSGKKVYIKAHDSFKNKIFSHWEVVSGGVTLDNPKEKNTFFTMPSNDVKIKPIFVYKDKYTVQVENGFSYSENTNQTEFIPGKRVRIVSINSPVGKAFSHWEVVSGSVALDNPNRRDTFFTMPQEDVVVKAVFNEIHNIKVEGGTSSVDGIDTTSTTIGKKVKIIVGIAPSGYGFSHWEVVSGGIMLNDSKSEKTYFTMPDNDVSIKAVFEKLYNIEVEGGVSYVDGSDTTSAISGKKVDIIVETVPEGQAFSHWEVVSGSVTLDDSNSRTTFFTMPEEDVVVKAIFEKGIGIEVKNGVAGIDGYKITHALENQNVAIFADIAPSGKKFAYWIVHEGGVVLYDSAFSPTGFVMGDKKVVVEAVYGDVYNVNILPTTNGSVVASKINDIISGTTINLTVTSDSGYELDELVVKDSANNVIPLVGTKFIMPASDVEVQATFKTPDPITFDLTTTVLGGHGSVSKGKTGLALNAMETVTFTPDANYEVDYVTVNGVIVMAVGNAYTVTMDSNKHVVVKYKKIGSPSTPQPTTFNLTTKVLSGKGDISQGKQDLALNSVETVTFTPEFGFEIDKVTVNGVEVSFIGNTYNVTMDSHKHVEVTYKDVRQTFSISYDLNGGTLQGKSGRVVILAKEGDTIKLPAAPYKPGYRFSYWKGSKYYPGDDYVVRDGHTFTAQWEKLAPTPINNSTMIVNPSNEVKYVNVKIPKTKDTTQTSLWLVVMMMSLVGLLGFNVLNKKQENK